VPCDDLKTPLCAAIKRKEVPSDPLTRDARIKAHVIGAPHNMFAMPDICIDRMGFDRATFPQDLNASALAF